MYHTYIHIYIYMGCSQVAPLPSRFSHLAVFKSCGLNPCDIWVHPSGYIVQNFGLEVIYRHAIGDISFYITPLIIFFVLNATYLY